MVLRMEFELCSLIFMLVFLMLYGIRRRSRSNVSGSTGFLVLFVCITEIQELLAIQVLQHSSSQNTKLLVCATTLTTMSFLPVCFGSFFVRRRRHETRSQSVLRLLNLIPWLVCVGMILHSVWSRYVFYIDAKGFHAGRLFWIFYLNYAVYSIIAFLLGVKRQRHRRIPLFLMLVMLVMGALPVVLARFFPAVPMYNLCMTGIVFLAFSSEEMSFRFMDSVSGALNREAFLFAVQEAEEHEQAQHVFAIGLDNFKMINEMYTVEGGNEIMRQIVENLQSEFSSQYIYRLGGDMFALLVPGDTECPKVLDTLRKLFSRPYKASGSTVRISACIGIVHTAHYTSSGLVAAMEYALSQAKAVGKAEVFEAAEGTADAIQRRKAIETAMMENLRNKRFEVHYQPIYDVRKKRFHSMEALARLNVPGYGYVSPEEFILIAEKNGTILSIGLLVLEEVCRFITESDLSSKGIEYVEVNLSVVQCTHDSIYASIREVLQKYNVPPEMINLELTESAAAYSEKKLIRNLARMSLMNLSFSLDDYGSGYSNINYIVTLPFNIAKIDKYLVWGAARSATSRIILEHIIAMFRAIHLKVVTEGIENAEMADMVIRMGADFLQGYYYSKPVPKELLLERLEEHYTDRFQ